MHTGGNSWVLQADDVEQKKMSTYRNLQRIIQIWPVQQELMTIQLLQENNDFSQRNILVQIKVVFMTKDTWTGFINPFYFQNL